MWDQLTDFEREWKATCRRFAEEEMAPFSREYDRANAFPEAVHERAYAAGMMNVGFPEALGGRGLAQRTLVVGAEELAAVCAPIAFTMGFNHGSLRPIQVGGTSEQQQVFIRDLLRARGLASICLTEPAASGSNLVAVGTRARRTERGWVVNGTKCMVGNGCNASLYVVLADAIFDGQKRGLSFFAVPRGPGVSVSANNDKIGFRCVTTPTVTFEDVEITNDHLIGPVGEAESILVRSLDFIRFGGASVIVGIVVGALRDLMPWLQTRKVYPSDPLLSKSNVQLDLARIYTRLRTTRMMLWRAADLLDRGQRCGTETSMAKLTASELAVDATGAIVQLYGWRGIDDAYSIQKRYRDARVTTIYEGTSEVQLLNIFRDLRLSLEGSGDL